MKKLNRLFITIALIGSFTSCEFLDDNLGLSSEEIIEGLKTALEIGTDSASTSLSQLNGYYHGDEQFIKIPLPEEAEQLRSLLNSNNELATLFNLDAHFENVVKAVNRAAETAATDAAPIFRDAITDLSISDGLEILNGKVPESAGQKSADFDSTAATQYLRLQTYNSLTDAFSPYINDALDDDLGLGFSAFDAWNTLTSTYNNTLNSSVVQTTLGIMALTGNSVDMPNQIETDLGVFSTQKALNGLFHMVGEEEVKIRRNPFEWALDIIQRVFGSKE